MSERPQPLKAINRFFEGKEPWQIVTMTASSVLAIVWAHSLYNAKDRKFTLIYNTYKNIEYRVKKYIFVSNSVHTSTAT